MEIADHSAESIVVYDLDGVVRYCNPASEALYGWQRALVVGTALEDVLPSPAVRQALLDRGEWEGLLEKRKIDGDDILTKVRLKVRRASDEIADIVEFAALANEPGLKPSEGLAAGLLDQRNFAHAAGRFTLGELTRSIAHELKQPFSAIFMDAETSLRYLSRPEPEIDKAVQITKRIVESSATANAIIGRVRQLAAKNSPNRELVDLGDVVRECLAFLVNETQQNNVDVQADLVPRLPKVMGIRVQLQQLVVNLMINSLQAMRETPRRLVVRTFFGENNGVGLSIEDSGPGVQPEHLDQVFESFFTTKDDGLGIGLTICRSIANAHGGNIEVANSAHGGAVFLLTIPGHSERL
jgi:PAS domain S-box-containing protein